MAKLITLGTLIDTTVEHYHHHFKELVGITLWLIVGATPFLFSGYIAPLGVNETTLTRDIILYLCINGLGLITTMITSFWITACITTTIHARAQGKTPDHAVLGKQAWKSIPSLIVLSLGMLLATIGVVIAGFAPGMLTLILNRIDGAAGTAIGLFGALLFFAGTAAACYALIRYGVAVAFSQYTLILEEGGKFSLRSIWRAVLSSHRAVYGSWWAIALRLFVPNAIISLVIIGAILAVNISSTVILSFAAASLSALAIKLIATALTLSTFIFQAIAMPLSFLATYYLYDSIRRTDR